MTETRDYNLIELENGIRVVHKEVTHTQVLHCGFVLDIGSRDEDEDEVGLAHFWEHMAFKGTKRRKAFHIINGLESVGGELNAYTTKEKIYFHATVMSKHFQKAFDLLTDITFYSTFPDKEIEVEKGVILEEMAMYLDMPEDAIADEFDEVVFANHPMGNNILGTQEMVRKFKKTDFQKFLNKNLDTENLVFSVVGNVSFKEVEKYTKKFLEAIPKSKRSHHRKPLNDLTPKEVIHKKPVIQSHVMIGGRAYNLTDDKRLYFFMLMNLLAGHGMGSRLNMALREKRGYVYAVDGSYNAYTDGGMYGLYFSTEQRHYHRALKVVKRELKLLREKHLGKVQLQSLKDQMVGQLAIAEENNSQLMQVMGKSMLDFGYIESLNSLFSKINAVDASQLADVANEVFQEELLSYLIYLPQDGVSR